MDYICSLLIGNQTSINNKGDIHVLERREIVKRRQLMKNMSMKQFTSIGRAHVEHLKFVFHLIVDMRSFKVSHYKKKCNLQLYNILIHMQWHLIYDPTM